MGKGSGRRGFVKRKLPPKEETPVRDRLRAVAASRHASSENVGTVESATPPSSVIDTIGSWINGSAPSEIPRNVINPEDSSGIAAVSNSPTPLSKKTKKKHQKSGNKRSRSTSFQSMDGSVDLFSAKASHGRSTSKQSTDLAEKRDSVISSTWGGVNLKEAAPTVMKQDLPEKSWSKMIRPSVWWPIRLYSWVRRIIFAVVQGFQGPRGSDFWLSLGLLLVYGYVACVALDFVIFGLIKGVKAQDLVEAANCSVVYVTIPGPIITVSLIAATPSDPARGTYYYSVINGTTEWLNSIAPPSRSSITATRTPVLTTPSLSQPAFGSTIEVPPSTLGSAFLPSLPPGIGTTFTTTISSGNTLTITTITLISSVTLPTNPPNSPLPPSASSIGDTPIDL
ncbi:hypothetical protein EJ07DRAFT_184348 [Lizonia empirigonia]|nr:hypothetical protein EJ07DRAFT_184348 [Lizonia empirigonia]